MDKRFTFPDNRYCGSCNLTWMVTCDDDDRLVETPCPQCGFDGIEIDAALDARLEEESLRRWTGV